MTQTIFSKTPDKRHSQLSLQCCINTLKQRQNCRHFADDIFKCVFLNENVWILFKISLTFVPKLQITNIPALVQKMAWHRPGSSLRPIHWSQLSREWRCSCSSADRRCSNYIWLINNVIAYQGVTYIRGLTVSLYLKPNSPIDICKAMFPLWRLCYEYGSEAAIRKDTLKWDL